MSDEILSLLGVEIELRVWRDTGGVIEAHFQSAGGTVVDLTTKRAILTVVDTIGAELPVYQQTVEPEDHTDAAGGVTRFTLPSSAFDALSHQRTYTWKYSVVLEDTVTAARTPFFYGDLRVLSLAAPV